MFQSIRRCLTSLHRFSGRDSQGQFWPYALVVFVLVMAGGMVMMAWAMAEFIAEANQYAAANPEAVMITQGPGVYHREVSLNGPGAPWLDIGSMVAPLVAILVVFVVLMAAAITRRLHDVGFSGWWALTPLVFITISLSLFPIIMQALMNDAGTDPALDPGPDLAIVGAFLALVVNNFLYLATLTALVIFLALPGKRAPNRFGPPVLPKALSAESRQASV